MFSTMNINPFRKYSRDQSELLPDQDIHFVNKVIKVILIIVGTISLGLGILGMVLPVLPTTPFLLLSAAAYARGSKRFYHWLMGNKWFGHYIKNYREGNGIPRKAKITAIAMLWTTILSSVIFFIDNPYVRGLLIVVALAVTWHLLVIKTSQTS
jgi:hypothetical protein